MSDRDVALRLRELQVHIAIDLMGHTLGSRPGVLAHRPAPISASFLGFPGTMGVDFIDYVIADEVVLPFDQASNYTEKIVHLPECFFPSDPTMQAAPQLPSRAQAGLPEQGFVFCCFNNSYKFSAPVFEVWMRLLAGIQGSVLWLSRTNDRAATNLRSAAQAHGIDPDRIVFASRVPSLADHLARQQLADLFLDTLPYNAHSTANDALRAGVPVLTCIGQAFAGRVAASMLRAVNLPELVARNLRRIRGDGEQAGRRSAAAASHSGQAHGRLAEFAAVRPGSLSQAHRNCLRHDVAALATGGGTEILQRAAARPKQDRVNKQDAPWRDAFG